MLFSLQSVESQFIISMKRLLIFLGLLTIVRCRIVSRGIPLAIGDCVLSEIGGQRCNFGGVSGFHSGRILRNVEPEVERGEFNPGVGDGSGQVPVMKRKKLKGKRAVVRWLKLFRWKKKKAFERMTAEEKILDKLRKVGNLKFDHNALMLLFRC